MNCNFIKIVFIAVFLTLAITGCGPVVMHSKGSLPSDQVAYLGFDPLGAQFIEVSLNGVENPHPGRTLEILPGQHTLKVRYQDKFENADLAIDDDAVFSDERSGIALARTGSCEISFQAKAGDSLFVTATPGSYSLFGGTQSPKIVIKESGFNQPAIFEATCTGETRSPVINIYRK